MEIKQLEYFAAAVEYGSLEPRGRKYAQEVAEICWRSERSVQKQGEKIARVSANMAMAANADQKRPPARAALAKEVFLRSSWSAEARKIYGQRSSGI